MEGAEAFWPFQPKPRPSHPPTHLPTIPPLTHERECGLNISHCPMQFRKAHTHTPRLGVRLLGVRWLQGGSLLTLFPRFGGNLRHHALLPYSLCSLFVAHIHTQLLKIRGQPFGRHQMVVGGKHAPLEGCLHGNYWRSTTKGFNALDNETSNSFSPFRAARALAPSALTEFMCTSRDRRFKPCASASAANSLHP